MMFGVWQYQNILMLLLSFGASGFNYLSRSFQLELTVWYHKLSTRGPKIATEPVPRKIGDDATLLGLVGRGGGFSKNQATLSLSSSLLPERATKFTKTSHGALVVDKVTNATTVSPAKAADAVSSPSNGLSWKRVYIYFQM
ncbi:hypothetical protein Nepgr_013693 [Nepenthes gracilis]|uniref:Uncharacterized protein n=1 Tax=Nepenthes gracilis TaxID=150966 RepID=A0AAD3SJQ1_NEPGR|nr:hypothetical protein Nepgr_013693 [Nepenthes gracilis]